MRVARRDRRGGQAGYSGGARLSQAEADVGNGGGGWLPDGSRIARVHCKRRGGGSTATARA